MIEQATRSTPDERLALANELFRAFHATCFWHSPIELEITEDLIPFVIRGLRTHGGHAGFSLAGRLGPDAIVDRGRTECP